MPVSASEPVPADAAHSVPRLRQVGVVDDPELDAELLRMRLHDL